MKISAEDYPAYKGFFGWIWTHHLLPQLDGMPSEASPVLVLEAFEAKSAATARHSLAMGLGDILEMLADLSPAEVTRIDTALSAAGWPTLCMVRARFDRAVASIRKRGRIGNEREYYALRNVVDDLPDAERENVWAILGAFEVPLSQDIP